MVQPYEGGYANYTPAPPKIPHERDVRLVMEQMVNFIIYDLRGEHVHNADTDHTVNNTFDAAEVKAALDNLATSINGILVALRNLGAIDLVYPDDLE